ncbi:hypothetical protein FHR24_000007 [Wenyingzhuangia heitensis]|uniref:Type 9 secretion system plug protein N-terminal domain-containing protein n=1 Tax=Wenyingzhuangia heitensis TaxID=1487859 RepID=A0ABX0U463_9FLAO|nr:DUF5103 domain-containing protein [Wenyingzhuangia heitensis]NIJ43568.1 hypothetical protein [Wenyingzhuangia heitensis]
MNINLLQNSILTKNYLMFYRSFFLIILYSSCLFSQINDAHFIKSVSVKNNKSEFPHTVHPLQSTVTFSFDDVTGNQEEYYYLITHCEVDWTPSDLPNSYYVDGFNNLQINNFENSFGTLQNYTHYNFTIPNENTTITKTGNYLFQILNEDETIVCERKITFYNNQVTVGLKISESRDLANFNKKQAVALTIYTGSLNINYPNQELKTFIYQNGDRQNKTPFLKPTFTSSNTYTYRPTQETEFYAGNEFYYFDNNEILRNSRFVAKNYREDNDYHSILFPKKSRTNSLYTYNPDINGSFVFRNFNSENTNTEAEYSKIHFALQNEKEFSDKDIYVYGAFNNFQFTDNNKLKLEESGKYLTTSILLKQGFYNYDFVIKNDDDDIDRHTISGSFYETENNYESLVYYQPINSIYYQVVGYGIANSKQQIEN